MQTENPQGGQHKAKSKKWWIVLPVIILLFLGVLLLIKHLVPDFPTRKLLPLIVLIIGGVFVWSGIGLSSKQQKNEVEAPETNEAQQDDKP